MSRLAQLASIAALIALAPVSRVAAQWPNDLGGRGSTGGLTFRPGERMVTLTWQRVDPTAQYRVFRATDSTSVGTDISGLLNATTFTDKTVSLNTVYFYHLRAEQSGGMKPMSSAPLRLMLQMGGVALPGARAPLSAPAPPPVALTVTGLKPNRVRAKTAPVAGVTYTPADPTITISGTGFMKQSQLAVYFTGTAADNPDVAGRIVSKADGTIDVALPIGARTGKVKVVSGAGVSSEMALSPTALTVTAPAAIKAFNPASGLPGSQLLIIGTWESTGWPTVAFAAAYGGMTHSGADESGVRLGDTAIRVRVPPTAATGKVSVSIGNGPGQSETVTSAMDFVVLAPPLSIESFSPAAGAVGSNVVITGYSHVTPVVTFANGVRAVVVSTVPGALGPKGRLSVTTVQVPAKAVTGPITIQSGPQQAVSATSFTVR